MKQININGHDLVEIEELLLKTISDKAKDWDEFLVLLVFTIEALLHHISSNLEDSSDPQGLATFIEEHLNLKENTLITIPEPLTETYQ